jgi:hypothetical protein
MEQRRFGRSLLSWICNIPLSSKRFIGFDRYRLEEMGIAEIKIFGESSFACILQCLLGTLSFVFGTLSFVLGALKGS